MVDKAGMKFMMIAKKLNNPSQHSYKVKHKG